MNSFHDDIVLNILVRLPVKSIGRNRCVSKYWYPCTKEYKKLPLTPIELLNVISYMKYGFGYDCKTGEYKVVSFAGYKDERGCEVQVYTLGSNCWRRLDRIPYDLSCNDRVNQVPVNGSHQLTFKGALHWIAKTDSIGAQASKVHQGCK